MKKVAPLSLFVQYPDSRFKDLVNSNVLRRWVQTTLLGPAKLTLRFVDETEARTLNHTYRKQDKATNVLTFCYTEDEDDLAQADIILCVDVIQKEANEQNKSVAEHLAHMIVHGALHAQGYDHETEEEAEEMEALEIYILKKLKFPNPYAAEKWPPNMAE